MANFGFGNSKEYNCRTLILPEDGDFSVEEVIEAATALGAVLELNSELVYVIEAAGDQINLMTEAELRMVSYIDRAFELWEVRGDDNL